ncbi:transposase [Streptomyces sp. NPDC048389]|uniref:transposase n=1 Tax=Streptomyces sp. NPDC048389 TaxID=3154622 RepID=UPI0034542083
MVWLSGSDVDAVPDPEGVVEGGAGAGEPPRGGAEGAVGVLSVVVQDVDVGLAVAGRPAENGQQAPSDLRRTRHPVKVTTTTAANVHDVTQPLALVDGIPSVASRPGRPRRRPEALLGDKGYDSDPNRRELRKRRILPVISPRGIPNIEDPGKLRYVVEQTFALLHQFKRLAVRCERRTELHNAFISLTCSLICWRRLKKART